MVSSIWRRTTISLGASFPTTSTRRARSAKRSPTCRRWGRKRRGMFRIKVCGVGGGVGGGERWGREPADGAVGVPFPVIKAVGGEGGGVPLEAYRGYPCSAFLLDAAVPGRYVGTGRTLDWKVLGRTVGGPLVR